MKESVDKQLKEHIIAVFDNYDDNGAGHGWLELRKKHRRKSQRRLLFWWSSAAAVLVMAVLFYKPHQAQQETVKIQQAKPRTSTGPAHVNRFENDRNAGPNPAELTKNRANVYEQQRSFPPAANQQLIVSRQNRTFSIASETSPESDPGHNEQPFSKDSLNAQVTENLHAQTETSGTQHMITDTAVTVKKTDPVIRKQIAEVLVQKPTDQPETSKPSHNNNKMELTFYAGAFLNYAEGSNNSMNMGAGISSGIPLNKRFTLVAGFALAKNTLIFKNELPSTSYLAFVAADNKAASSFLQGNVPQISKLEARLLNLDIPVNIKYSLSRKPNKVFVSAGLSSFAYLNEAYRYSYNNMNNGTNTLASADDQVINESFGKFDLAQTLNFSFGLTRTGKAQNFIFEPFIKYPLGTLGSQDIRFGSAGVNLKLNINQGQKPALKKRNHTVK